MKDKVCFKQRIAFERDERRRCSRIRQLVYVTYPSGENVTRIVDCFQRDLGPYIVGETPLAGSADASAVCTCDRERTLTRVHDHISCRLGDTAGRVGDMHRVRATITDGCVGDNRVLISVCESTRAEPSVR